jgi:hypothetical protein
MAPTVSVLSITAPGFINRGNLIIEQAARRVLGIGPTALSVNAHRSLSDRTLAAINETDVCVLPGATLIEPRDHRCMARITEMRVPMLALGVAFNMRAGEPDLRVAKRLGLPIGSRDPFTHRALQHQGIPSRLVGCQTLLMSAAERWQRRGGPVVASLGLGGDGPQVDCIRAIADDFPVIVLAHAPGYQAEVDHPNVRTRPLESLDGVFKLFRKAALVVTGRIHGVLSCLSLGTPVLFVSSWNDSRYDLLRYLGVRVRVPTPAGIRQRCRQILGGARLSPAPLERADDLRRRMRDYLEEVAVPLGLPTPAVRPGFTPVVP